MYNVIRMPCPCCETETHWFIKQDAVGCALYIDKNAKAKGTKG